MKRDEQLRRAQKTLTAAVLAVSLCVTPAAAESADAAAIEAHCPPYFPRGNAVKATLCNAKAARSALAHRPGTLELFDALVKGNLVSARKFDAGKITAEQYVAETQARGEEFEAKNNEGSSNGERAQQQEQCSKIIKAMSSPLITPALEAAALEKLRNLGCLE